MPLEKSLSIEKNNKKIEKLSKKSDLIIIADYGHHFLSKNIMKIINNKNFVTVNAQINSSTYDITVCTSVEPIKLLLMKLIKTRN